ncbi:aldehyde dehydrogenase family protein [Variovorax sp. J22P168]|uniref:aldehyde dehydrogenase family protein n=1 Tax=Variovorax jilinensis TaxID=3053513 RepID=UPI0025770C9C|nr:aldehyde dehydrogenase family protein [Variovorax sp. J22P168]MDM0015242.1 aldehyde dehydrogenase family protein [Variovorax sp. J22P168]
MNFPDYAPLVAAQRAFFVDGHTRPIGWRKRQLEAIQAMFTDHHDDLCDALWKDLRRNVIDADLMDVGYCAREAAYALRHIDAWVKPTAEPTPMVFEPGDVRVNRDPLGVSLIIGAWNEPFMLLFGPLVAALAAGNTAVLKPSEVATNCAAAAARLVPKYFDPRAVAVVEGGVPETTALLAQQWDMIFFTGSPRVGKIVHQAAAQNLTPCVLELGGKNPTIVHSSADLEVAARRIAYGRFLNAGQICTAPDHVLVWPDVKDEFVQHLDDAIRAFYGDDPQQSPDYGRVVDRRNFDRLAALIDSGKAVVGGQTDVDERYIAPTVLVDVSEDSLIMKEEIFGPILPVLAIDSVSSVIRWVNSRPSPLSLYVFAEDSQVIDAILSATRSGDVEINDCAIHPLFPELPFGGVGNSGMGKYHGKWGFEAFTNARGVFHHSTRVDPRVRYPPYARHGLERAMLNRLTP